MAKGRIIGVMLGPVRETVKRLLASWRAARALRALVAWGLGLWAATVAVPAVFLWPDEGLDRPVSWALCGLPPLALGLAALSGEAAVVLAFGLLTLLPAMVACPELQGPRTSGPIQALLVAALLLGFVAEAWRAGRPTASAVLWRLWPRPSGLRAWLWAAWGGLALLLAWLPAATSPDLDLATRPARVATAALGWLAVRHVPLGRPNANTLGAGLLTQRLVWLLLFGVAWWLWRRAAV